MNQKMYYVIYKTTNSVNGRYYIGMHRTSNYNDSYMGSGVHLKTAIKKYGKEKFTKEILFFAFSYEDMKYVERKMVNEEIVLSKKTYNQTLGGGGSLSKINPHHNIYNELSKQKMKDTMFSRYGVHHSSQLETTKESLRNRNIQSKACKGKVGINNGIIEKTINKDDFDRYILSGWVKGYLRNPIVGKITINKNNEIKLIDESELCDYKKTGWERGSGKSHNKGRVYIKKDKTNKRVFESEVEYHIQNGWERGMFKKPRE